MNNHASKHDAPAVAHAKIGGGSFTPVCEEGLYQLRAMSNKAGKKSIDEIAPPLPKGASAADKKKHETAVADIRGRNLDDVLPIEVKALSEFEQSAGVTCFGHRIAELKESTS